MREERLTFHYSLPPSPVQAQPLSLEKEIVKRREIRFLLLALLIAYSLSGTLLTSISSIREGSPPRVLASVFMFSTIMPM